jgi:hypothetical protein
MVPSIGMEEVSTTRERIDFLTENYNLNENNAKALILTELGFSHSGIASKLGVTDGTARKYLCQLEDEIGEMVTQSHPKPIRYATYPGDDVSEPKYAGDYIDYAPKFKERELPINRGKSLEEIPDRLITIKG